jgi:hypothetical protein
MPHSRELSLNSPREKQACSIAWNSLRTLHVASWSWASFLATLSFPPEARPAANRAYIASMAQKWHFAAKLRRT